MKAKEWIFKNYPEQKEDWGLTNHDDEFMCRMMEEYAGEVEWADPAEWVPDSRGPFLVWCESEFGPEYSGIHYFDVNKSEFYIKSEWDEWGRKEYLNGVLAWRPVNRPSFLPEMR